MPIVQPSKERHSIQDQGSSLKIVIPSRKNFFLLFFLGFWLTLWALAEIGVGGALVGSLIQLLFQRPEMSTGGLAGMLGGGFFMLLWLAIWTAGGVFALYNFFWQLAGKELVEIDYESIRIQRAIFGFGPTKQYLAPHIKDLRVSPVAENHSVFGWSRASSFWGNTGGHLAFDYGSKTIRFGGGVEEAEAKQILEKIIARFPQFGVHQK